MGIDWIRERAGAWKRTWDRGLENLCEPNLFTNRIEAVERTFRARPLPGELMNVGQEYVLRILDGNSIGVFTGVLQIAQCDDPPPELLKKIAGAGCGVAIGLVRQVYEYTKCAEFAVN